MKGLRTGAFVVVASLVGLACTFTRSLDYLQSGDDAGSASSSSGTSTSSSSSSGGNGEAGAMAGTVLVSAQANPDNLVQDADHLYWSVDSGAIMRVAKAGGAAQEVFKLGGGTTIDELAVDAAPDGRVYFISGGSVQWVPKAGGSPMPFLPGTADATSIAADNTFVFVTHTLSVDDATTTLTRYPKDNPTMGINLSPAGESDSLGIALTADAVVWSATNTDTNYIVNQTPKTALGPPPAVVFQNTGKDPQDSTIDEEIMITDSSQMAIDDQAFYWIDSSYLAPWLLPRAAPKGKAITLLNPKSSAAQAIFVDAQFVYVTNDPADGPPQLVRIGKVDPFKTEPFGAQLGPRGIAVDDKAIYYAFVGAGGVGANGGIQRVPK